MRSFNIYKNILKQKGVRYSLTEVWRLFDRFHYIKDQDILNQVWQYKVYKRLYKKYAHFKHIYTPKISATNPYPNKIWVCWLQGEGNAPLLVQSKHSVNHVFFPQTSVINFTSQKQSYDDTRRSSRDNELLQRAQSDL